MYFVLSFKVKIDFSSLEIKLSFKFLKTFKASKIFEVSKTCRINIRI